MKKDYNYDNLTPPQKQALAVVERLGIYELRALSRVFGDNAPTTLKRNDHIRSIMGKIISGEELEPIPLRQGRPYKELSNIGGILEELSSITGKDYLSALGKSATAPQIRKEISFKQIEEDVVSKQLFPIKAKGILSQNSNGDFFFFNQHNSKLVLVNSTLVEKLSPNDFIEGTAVLMNTNDEYILKSIERVNFEDFSLYSRTESPYKKCMPNQKFSIEKKEILLGGRYRLTKLSQFAAEKERLKKIVALFKKQNISTVAIVPNVPDEDLLDIQLIDFDNSIVFKYNEQNKNLYQSFLCLNDYIKRQQQLGKSLAIFIQDPVTLANVIDFYSKNQPKVLFNHTENAVNFFKELGALCCAAEGGKSTTMFVTCDESDLFDPLYVSLIYKIFKPIEL